MTLGLVFCVAMSTPPTPDPGPDALLGAVGPGRGRVVPFVDGGVAFVLPHLSAGFRVGISRRAWLGLRYRTVSGLSHAGRLEGGWGAAATPKLWVGFAPRTTISTLAPADGIMGIQFTALELGNDWEVGGDIRLTVMRPRRAQLTFGLGTTATLGGIRYTTYDDRKFEIDPAMRAINAGFRGEWVRTPKRNLYLGFEAVFLLSGDPIPIGFLPIVSLGGAWWL